MSYNGSLSYSGVFRVAPYPTIYEEIRTPWLFDMELTGIGIGYLVTSICYLLLLPSIRFRKKECVLYWGGFLMLWTGGVILLCTFGHAWSAATLTTTMPYISNSNLKITGEIGVWVGLRGLNITLVGNPLIQANHTINYNERFWWGGEDVLLPSVSWGQGREGFGPYAGQISQEFRKQLERGVPTPIQWVAEYWIPDGEYIRWGRYYRWGAYYTYSTQWTAWCFWFLTCILLILVPMYGAYMLGFTGSIMVLGNILYGGLVQTVNGRIGFISIPFEQGRLEPGYGWSFYLNLFWGLGCLFVGSSFALWLTYNRLNEKKDEYRFSMELEPMDDKKNDYNNNNNNNGYNNNNNNNYHQNNNNNQQDNWKPLPPKTSNPPQNQWNQSNQNNYHHQQQQQPQVQVHNNRNQNQNYQQNNNQNNDDFYSANAYGGNDAGNGYQQHQQQPQGMYLPPRGTNARKATRDVQVIAHQ